MLRQWLERVVLRKMGRKGVHLTLEPAPDDPPRFSAEYQLGIRSVLKELANTGIQVAPRVSTRDSAPLPVPGADLPIAKLTGELTLLAQTITPLVGTVIGAWIAARNGRKVRIKVGDIEAEANTTEQVEKLLARAQEIKDKGSRRILEP